MSRKQSQVVELSWSWNQDLSNSYRYINWSFIRPPGHISRIYKAKLQLIKTLFLLLGHSSGFLKYGNCHVVLALQKYISKRILVWCFCRHGECIAGSTASQRRSRSIVNRSYLSSVVSNIKNYTYLSSVSMHMVQSSPPISAARETIAAIKPEAVEAASPRAIKTILIYY